MGWYTKVQEHFDHVTSLCIVQITAFQNEVLLEEWQANSKESKLNDQIVHKSLKPPERTALKAQFKLVILSYIWLVKVAK